MSVVTLNKTITLALSVKDRHASATWYHQMLGFDLLFHMDEAGWSELSTNTTGVTLGLGEQGQASPGNTVPVFGVDDLNGARQSLENAGVDFDGDSETIEGMVSLATFYDPDGNALMIAQELA